jgi:predicted transcriptional regulator
MGRKVFFSFNYKEDNWRASQIRNIGRIEGNQSVSDNDWEAVKRGGDVSIRKWIDQQMQRRSCIIVLVGSHTANRKWINYEIASAWNSGRGLFGIRIHGIKDKNGRQSSKGNNPFSKFVIDKGQARLANFWNLSDILLPNLADVVKLQDPASTESQEVYRHIADNLGSWIEEAIEIRL